MSGFWDKKAITTQETAYQQAQQALPAQPITLDEEALAEIQENEEYDVFEEEDDDMSSVLSDANLRLEQGRLYQMIMNSDIFGETDADPKAIKNVSREMRKFARDRMEMMLGMRQEEVTQKTIVSSPFNDMEVTVLKLLASKMSKGATEEQAPAQPLVQAPPKKDGITAISGTTRPKAPAPLKRESKPIQRAPQPKMTAKPTATSAIKSEEDTRLTKAISEMTPAELAEYDKKASEIHARKHSAMPPNLIPHPSPQQLEAIYTAHANQLSGPGSALGNVMALMNKR